MDLFGFLLTFTVILSNVAQAEHRDVDFFGCSDTEKEYLQGFDGEELYHSDFIRKVGVVTAPDFADPMSYPGFYENSVAQMEVCKQDLATDIKAYNSPEEQLDPPVTSIYSEDEVVLDERNTLICHVTGFFPPPVNVSWTKNNDIVTEEISFSQYRRNSDGTFNMFSALKFTPAEGDIYSCTVNHRSIQGQPNTKTWEVDVELPSVGPAVFCGVGLVLGLLGVAAGTFFLIKGNNCN
uniref:major histocompatibility complex class II integral membrane alpha chain gene 1 precursor n=1 Tax=Danio rerio TaxID=7955 RepID=UPI000005FDA5|nr:major histocompatibility complex class II integral membrane alpha chain gene 1 precursor [Danio rerio]AAA16368.1 MHC class II alpha chain [Danio rerio]AAA16369.1 MHC class II alpha chain [Danio rerio]